MPALPMKPVCRWMLRSWRVTDRGTTRLFLVVPAPVRREHLHDRLHDLERSHWADELVVYWASDR